MIHNHEGSLLSPPDGGTGTETCGVGMPNEAAMPGDTGWSPKANGMVALALDPLVALLDGAFWAPRTLVAEPRGAVQRAEAASPEKIELSPSRDSQDRTFTHVSEVTATIRDVDYARRRVTLLGPGGWQRIINVSDNVQNLDDLNEGDLIAIRYTEAVVIGITK